MQGQLPRHLEAWLIETRKSAAGVGRLELAVNVPLAVFLQLENTGTAVAADLALIGDVQNAPAGNRAIEGQADELVAARYRLRGLDDAGLRTKCRVLNEQANRIQPNQFSGCANVNANVDAAVERIAIRNQRKIHCVAQGLGRSVQSQLGRLKGRRGECHRGNQK